MSDHTMKNMEEFAAAVGISRPTVSKYFHNPDSVRKSTRERIEAALETYDYRPNIYAMNQNRRLTNNIGVVVPYLSDPFFAEIARKIEYLVNRAGFHPILLTSHGDSAHEVKNLEGLRLNKPAGVLMAPLGRSSERKSVEDFCNDIPTVLFDSNIDDIGEAFIGHDNGQATTLICEYLCRTGKPPAFFEMLKPTNPNAYRRRQSFCDVMRSLGHEPRLIQVEGEGWDFEKIGFEQGKKAITENLLNTDTVLCSNDRLAIGFLSAAYKTGRRVGRSDDCALRVAGHDDHPFSRYTCPSLTTVSQDYTAIAEKSVETLLNMIETGDRPERRETTLFDGKLIMRDSA